MHGGAICTLVDMVTCYAVAANTHKPAGVSVEISVSFLSGYVRIIKFKSVDVVLVLKLDQQY